MKSSASAALATLALALVPASLQAREITVPSGSILTIQQGVDAAAPGDTVLVRPGTYTEAVGQWWPPVVHIAADKPGLKLKAAGAPGTVRIVGPGQGRGILINAENVGIEGFDISGFADGIYAGGAPNQGGRINRNTIHDCSVQCITVTGSNAYEIDHNLLDGGQHGIFLNGWPDAGPNTRHHIHHNVFKNASDTGILLWLSPDCAIEHNEIINNGVDGIYVRLSPNCALNHNQANNNAFTGLSISGSPDCQVTGNEANNNGVWGIAVAGSCGSNFSHNSAWGNGAYDLFAPNWEDTEATCNTYQKNRADTAVPSLALWDVK